MRIDYQVTTLFPAVDIAFPSPSVSGKSAPMVLSTMPCAVFFTWVIIGLTTNDGSKLSPGLEGRQIVKFFLSFQNVEN